MSVYIKDMEMPGTCFECPFMFARRYCCASLTLDLYQGDYDEIKGRVDGCPLVPVPPHGRLGDLNELYEKFARLENEAMNALKTTTTGSVNWIKWSAILTERTGYKYDIADAPTIIEAEGDS